MKLFRILLIAALASLPGLAHAQTAAKQPFFAATNAWVDLANGPTELLMIEGSGVAYTSGGGAGVTGTSAGTTALTLSGTPAVAPCVGCVITCAPTNTAACTIPGGTTVTAFNGTTGVTTSVATTVTAASLNWGAACPVTGTFPTAPSATGNTLSAPLNLRAAVGGTGAGLAIPVYTTARVCIYGGQQQGGTFVNFPIGAW
jgi:hypothetical protein